MNIGVTLRRRVCARITTAGAFVIVLSLLLVTSVSAGCNSSSGGALTLIPDYALRAIIWDVNGIMTGDLPPATAGHIEREWEVNLEDTGISLDDIETIIVVPSRNGDLRILEGNFDFAQIRDDLGDEEGYEYEEYLGYKLWTHTWWGTAALLDKGGYVLMGSEAAVKYVLDSLSRGSGSLLDLDKDDTDLRRALKRVGNGWIVTAARGCGVRHIPGCEYRGVESVGIAISRGKEAEMINFKMAFLFDSESTAKSKSERREVQKFLRDEFYDELPRGVDIENVIVDGEFVVITATVDREAMYFMSAYPRRW